MRFSLLLALAIGGALSASAAHITAEQALDRALAADGRIRFKSLNARQLKQVKVDAQNVYVFNSTDSRGFLITSADDRLRPVLGYADEGSIDPADMSPELRWWLSEYDREIAALMPAEQIVSMDATAQTTPQTKSAVTDNYAQWEAIAPICTTKWNQSAPYYDMCPLYGNISNYPRCVTGCVATAMAQVVYANRYYKGTGSNSYYPWGTQYGAVSFNYAGTTINFAAMKDTYTTSDSGTTAGNAVATLMKACGVGVNMQYSYDQSGAYSEDVPGALINYFGYDANGTCYIDRTGMSTDRYEATIYNELKNGRPMCYSGSSVNGGHCFVVDGYSGNGMFHINWGWGGVSDGYFALTALNPGEQGIGSSEGGYNYRQGIVTVAKPGSTDIVQTVNGVSGYLTYQSSTIYSCIAYTGNDSSKTVYPAIYFYNAAGELVKTQELNSTTITKNQYTKTSFTPNTSGLAAGQYKLQLLYRGDKSADFMSITPYLGFSTEMVMTLSSSGSKSYAYPTYDLKISDISTKTIYRADGGNLQFTVVNTGNTEINTGIGLSLTTGNTTKYYDLNGSETSYSNWLYLVPFPVNQIRKIGLPIAANALSVGKYTVKLLGANKMPISDDTFEFEVVSGSNPATETLTSNWKVVDESVIPEVWIKGDTYTHSVSVYSAAAQSSSAVFRVNIYEKGTDNIKQSWTGKYGWSLTSGDVTYDISALNDNGETFTINVPFGTYDLQYYIYPSGKASSYTSYKSSQRRTIRVGEKLGDYALVPDAEGTGLTIAGAPTGNVEIPESFTLSDKKTRAVTDLHEGLYQNSKTLTGLSIPATVTSIGTYALAGCPNLDYVVLNNPQPAFDYVQVIAQNSNENCAWYVPHGSYNDYQKVMTGCNLYEIPSDMTGCEVYMDPLEEGTLPEPFAEQGVYNYTRTESAPAVATVDENLNVSALAEGTNVVTYATPAPFENEARLVVNVINPVDCDVENLATLWVSLENDELLPTVTPGTMRSRNHYILQSEMHLFDRQPDYALATDACYNNERLHGFKLTGLPAETDHAYTFNVSGRLVSENGLNSLRVDNVTSTETPAEAVAQSLHYGTFDPATDAAEWLHTYAIFWYATYDADNNVLTGFSKARSADASALPVVNLNNVELPMMSNRYDPVGYIDTDSDGNYFFVPTQDFGDVSTGVTTICADTPGTDARYFNLQGIEVRGHLTPGLYIRKTADGSAKVVVR